MAEATQLVTSIILYRDQFLAELRQSEADLATSISRMSSMTANIRLQPIDNVTPAIDKIVSDAEGRTIRLNVEADGDADGGSGGGGGGGFGRGIGGMLAVHALLRAKEIGDQVYRTFENLDKAQTPLEAAKSYLRNQESGGLGGAIMDKSGLTEALGGETKSMAAATVAALEASAAIDKLNESRRRSLVAGRGEVNTASRRFTPYDVNQAPELAYLNEIGAGEAGAGGFMPAGMLAQISREADQIHDAVAKRDEKRKELSARRAELNGRDANDPETAAKLRAIEDETQANEAASRVDIDRIKRVGELKRDEERRDQRALEERQSMQDAIARDEIAGRDTVAEKGKVELREQAEYQRRVKEDGQEAADDWKRNVGDPQAAHSKDEIDRTNQLKDIRASLSAESIAGQERERQLAAEGHSDEARHQAEIRRANEDAQAARALAESKHGSEDYGRLDQEAMAKEQAAASLPTTLAIESMRKAEQDLADAHAERLGMWDAEAGKIEQIQNRYDKLVEAADSVKEKQALRIREQVELDEASERQRQSTADIREHAQEKALEAAGRERDAQKMHIEYEYGNRIRKEEEALQEAHGNEQKQAIQDRMAALRKDEAASEAALQDREVHFAGPMAAWERMQRMAFAVDAKLPPAGGNAHAGNAAGTVSVLSGAEGGREMKDAAEKLGNTSGMLSSALMNSYQMVMVSE